MRKKIILIFLFLILLSQNFISSGYATAIEDENINKKIFDINIDFGNSVNQEAKNQLVVFHATTKNEKHNLAIYNETDFFAGDNVKFENWLFYEYRVNDELSYNFGLRNDQKPYDHSFIYFGINNIFYGINNSFNLFFCTINCEKDFSHIRNIISKDFTISPELTLHLFSDTRYYSQNLTEISVGNNIATNEFGARFIYDMGKYSLYLEGKSEHKFGATKKLAQNDNQDEIVNILVFGVNFSL